MQVLQQGGTEPPTKPKGRPKKSFLAAAASGAHDIKDVLSSGQPETDGQIDGHRTIKDSDSLDELSMDDAEASDSDIQEI